MTRKINPPIPGHELKAEGSTGVLKGFVYGGCWCGALPPDWHEGMSANAVRRWHRQHKAELREDDKP